MAHVCGPQQYVMAGTAYVATKRMIIFVHLVKLWHIYFIQFGHFGEDITWLICSLLSSHRVVVLLVFGQLITWLFCSFCQVITWVFFCSFCQVMTRFFVVHFVKSSHGHFVHFVMSITWLFCSFCQAIACMVISFIHSSQSHWLFLSLLSSPQNWLFRSFYQVFSERLGYICCLLELLSATNRSRAGITYSKYSTSINSY